MEAKRLQQTIEESLLRNLRILAATKGEGADDALRCEDVACMLRAAAANLAQALSDEHAAASERVEVLALEVERTATHIAGRVRGMTDDEAAAVRKLRQASFALCEAQALLEDEEARAQSAPEGGS